MRVQGEQLNDILINWGRSLGGFSPHLTESFDERGTSISSYLWDLITEFLRVKSQSYIFSKLWLVEAGLCETHTHIPRPGRISGEPAASRSPM